MEQTLTSDPRPTFRDILGDVLGACPERERLLVHPSLESLWQLGLPYEYGGRIRNVSDDITWWFVEAFAEPEVVRAVKSILDSVPGFFFKLARLSSEPARIDWNLVNQLRSHLKVAAWEGQSAYQIATSSVRSEASRKAAALVRRLTTEEEWQQKFSS